MDAPEMCLEIVTPPAVTQRFCDFTGRACARVSGDSRWKESTLASPLDAEIAQPLAGTEGGSFPFWSPDNESVAFFAGGQLKRIDVAGGFVQTWPSAVNTRGGAWNPGHNPLYSLRHRTAVSRTRQWREGRARNQGHTRHT